MGPIPAHCTTLRSELDSVADLSTLVSKFLSDDKRKNAVMCCYEDKNFMLFGMIPMQRHHCRCCQNSICDNHTRYVKFLPTGNIDGNQANNNSYESYNVCADNSDLQCVKLCTECVNILDDFSKKSAKDADTQLTDVSKLSNENSGPVPIVKEAEKLEVVNIPVSETVNTTALVVEEAEKKEVVNTPVSETTNTTSPIVEEAEKKEVEKKEVIDTPVSETINTTSPIVEEAENKEVISIDATETTTEEVSDANNSTDIRNSEGAKKKRNKNKNKKN